MSAVRRLESAGELTSLDRRLAAFVSEHSRGLSALESETLELLVALLSRALREGHACLEITEQAERRVIGEQGEELVQIPSLSVLRSVLEKSGAVEVVTEEATSSFSPEELSTRRPLVFHPEGRLYFRRYDEHELRLAAAISRLRDVDDEVISPALRARLDHYFPLQDEIDLQRRAAELALLRRFLVISGGPGTGKTSTVVKILALLAERALASGESPPRVLLLAPTGKAAARLVESIRGAKAGLEVAPEIIAAITEDSSTIHRALGVRPDSSTRYLRTQENPLPEDVILVDEASMVDLALMRHLVEAVRPDARLILLGDRYQLASVEAGSVLAELCQFFSPGLEETSSHAEGQSLVQLEKSYRFSERSGIYRLAASIRQGDSGAALAALRESSDEVSLHLLAGEPRVSALLKQHVLQGFRRALRLRDPARVLEALTTFRVLAAHRRGPFGVESLNQLFREWLGRAGLVPLRGEFFRGRPVMITRNDPGTRLNNGDFGLVWPDASGRMSVFFEEGEGRIRQLSPAQLPEHETAFAMTIHKSQGSEYDDVLVVLPEANSPLLSRELLYTAVTRAKRRAILFGQEGAIVSSCQRSLERASGLGRALASRSRAG